MSVETLSIHTITIEQNTGTATGDGKGGWPDSWAVKYEDIKARIQPRSANERSQWGGLPTVGTHVIYVPDASLAITEKDRIIFGTRTFNILGVRDIDEWGRFLTIDAEEIRD